MVRVSKPISRRAISAKACGLAALALLAILIGASFKMLADLGNTHPEHAPPKIRGVGQPDSTARNEQLQHEAIKAIRSLEKLDGPEEATMSKYRAATRKECIPGRDDAKGEINPTTHKGRECLRHVPIIKGSLEGQQQKPRIGILFPPGAISYRAANWISSMLESTSQAAKMDINVIVTSQVPVYGYGKSHGFTKLIRLNALPLSLGALDSYVYSKIGAEGGDNGVEQLLKLFHPASLPSSKPVNIEKIMQLNMRWQCRLSHVSAHTSMLTLLLDDLLQDPKAVLEEILQFVWRDDWQWQGKSDGRQHSNTADLDLKASSLIQRDMKSKLSELSELLKISSLVVGKAVALVEQDHSFRKDNQEAFADEMRRSKDMTSWPCPSFWEGVNGDETLTSIASQMVPNCRDDDPFVNCSVNRDRCEVKRDPVCT